MKVSKQTLLSELPPYRDQWELIHPDQTVDDIISEVLTAHREFAPYYDKIALYFDAETVEDICRNLYKFCRRNIRYVEEGKEQQTSALPTGMLIRGYGDCKHYAGFCAGVLDSIGRLTGKKINWTYRFVSNNLLNPSPHHVFVVVNDEGRELWIDPVPGSENYTPVWQQDGKPKKMALIRNIGSVNAQNQDIYEAIPELAAIGASLTVHAKPGIDNLDYDGTGKYKNVFGPYLGLDNYRDYGGDRDINESALAAEINTLIAGGPNPGHTVPADFVKWVYDNSIRSWNFYYPGGVMPGFNADSLLPTAYPRPVITDDGRLTLDRDAQLDDYRNPEIHLLTAWLQDLINRNDDKPYPLRPVIVKQFSQSYTGNPGNMAANFLNEWRGSSIFKDIGKALEDTVNFVKEGVLKVIGSIPRNAFLALVGLNVFNFAGNLWSEIGAGNWEHIAGKWRSLGGNPDKLRSTIEHGKDKRAILGSSIGEPISASTAALITAATPIIMALLQFLNRDGKLNGVIGPLKSALSVAFPGQSFDFLDGVLVNKTTGQPVQFEVDPRDDENLGGGNDDMPGSFRLNSSLMFPILGAVLGFFLGGKKPANTKLIYVAGGAGLGFLLAKGIGSSSGSGVSKRDALVGWINSGGDSPEGKAYAVDLFRNKMSNAEIDDVYRFVFDYFKTGQQMPADLSARIAVISDKYQIFT